MSRRRTVALFRRVAQEIRRTLSSGPTRVVASAKEAEAHLRMEQQDVMYLRESSGVTGENLLRTLELRFDNVVYRMGFAPSRAAAIGASASFLASAYHCSVK